MVIGEARREAESGGGGKGGEREMFVSYVRSSQVHFRIFRFRRNTCGHKSVVPFLQQSGSEVATNEGCSGNEK